MLEPPPVPETSAEAPQLAPGPRTWNLADALLIAVMYAVALVLASLFAAGVVHLLHRDPKVELASPLALLGLQLGAYGIAFLCARIVIPLKTGRPFFASIEWNYPGPVRLPQLLLAGLTLAVFVITASQFLPVPKGLPVEKFFQTRSSAMSSMIFATLVAPFAEEIYFRGILWGGLCSALADEEGRRRVGIGLLLLTFLFAALAASGRGSGYAMFAPVLLLVAIFLLSSLQGKDIFDPRRQRVVAVILTGSIFAFVHGAQLANSWAPLFVLLIVGLVLTFIRATMNSVAASWILHTGYNGTLFLLMWAQTEGFRKLHG